MNHVVNFHKVWMQVLFFLHIPRRQPNCYECIWREDLPGDAHSCCKHYAFKKIWANPLFNLMEVMSGHDGSPNIRYELRRIKIIFDKAGARWFHHPFSYDPIWLRSCTGFKQKHHGRK